MGIGTHIIELGGPSPISCMIAVMYPKYGISELSIRERDLCTLSWMRWVCLFKFVGTRKNDSYRKSCDHIRAGFLNMRMSSISFFITIFDARIPPRRCTVTIALVSMRLIL